MHHHPASCIIIHHPSSSIHHVASSIRQHPASSRIILIIHHPSSCIILHHPASSIIPRPGPHPTSSTAAATPTAAAATATATATLPATATPRWCGHPRAPLHEQQTPRARPRWHTGRRHDAERPNFRKDSSKHHGGGELSTAPEVKAQESTGHALGVREAQICENFPATNPQCQSASEPAPESAPESASEACSVRVSPALVTVLAHRRPDRDRR